MKKVLMTGTYNVEIKMTIEIEVPNLATEENLYPIISALDNPNDIDDYFLSKYECRLIRNEEDIIYPNSVNFKEFNLKIGEPE